MKSQPIPSVDHYIADGCGRCMYYATPKCKVRNWQDELNTLRAIVLSCDIQEEIKWGVPVYTYKGKNIVNVSALKDACVMGFFKGALLQDPDKVLQQQGKNSQSARIMKFTDASQIIAQASQIQVFIQEAIANEEAGKKIVLKSAPETISEELQLTFTSDLEYWQAFYELTPGRQRGYHIYFSQPKQSQTRINRIEKCRAQILLGVGLHDQYSNK
jgi:uncharacterized protein YdeI (YjbR/CyaY-like superfamily)